MSTQPMSTQLGRGYSRARRSSACVESIRATAYTVPTDLPEADGTLAWNSTTLVLVELDCDGITGLGWTYGPAACAQLVGELLAPVVLGADPMNTPGSFEAMVTTVRNAGRPGAVGYALSAVDTALWDLKARLLGLSLHRLLGATRDSVPVYGSGGFTTYNAAQQHEQLTGWANEQRIPRVKIKIGESWGTNLTRDLTRLAAARDTIGPEVELYADANGAYSPTQAIRLMHAAAELDVRWLEEPVSSDNLAGLTRVRHMVGADVAAGEYGYELTYFQRMCTAGAVDCLQADVTRCGGITEWLRVAALAAAHHLQLSGHCAPHLHAHVAVAIPNLRHLEWFHDHVRIETHLFEGTLDPAGGVLRPDPLRPGHGLVCRAEEASRYQVGDPVTRELSANGTRS